MADTTANKAVVQRLFDGLARADFDTMMACVSEEIVVHSPVPGEWSGADGFRQFLQVFLTGFPEQHTTVEDLLAEGDLVVARHTHHATHGGEFAGIPPTGRRVSVPGIEMFRIRDGRIAEFWHMDDLLLLMRELGAVPA
jgi:steroid delta-isomerase-like uncharacterized protein